MPAPSAQGRGEDEGETLLPSEIREEGGSAAHEAGVAVRGGETPPRSPIRKLAGSLLGALGRKKPGPAAPADSGSSPRLAGQEEGGEPPAWEPGAQAQAEIHPQDTEPVQAARAPSPLHRFAGAFSAALQSLSPPRTLARRVKWEDVGQDEPDGTELSNPALAVALRDKTEFSQKELRAFQVSELTPDCYIKVGERYFKLVADAAGRDADNSDTDDRASEASSGPRGARSLPAASPARTPLASARSLPETLSGATKFKQTGNVVVAASKFKRGMKKRSNRIAEAIPEGDEAGREVDFASSLQQAEDGMLRELYKETRLFWRLDRAGVMEEINSNFKATVKKSASLFEFVDFDYSNEEDEEKEDIMQERYVRCFVSAPYSDMQAERRLLAQEVFPAIRQRCMEIGVHFMECDFGWGVSESIAERKSTIMERMLEMRQNIKTYIIGLVAERYGYTYLLNSMPGHLAQDPMYVGKRAAVLGLQEIELDEGPLARDIPHTAFYYTRDSQYLDTVEDTAIRGALQSEGLLARERLSHLKAKLRLSNVPIRENYANPEEFATLALGDLTTKIVEDFPHDATQEMLMHVDKQLMHEFEESTLKVFEGREEDMASLDDRVLSVQTITSPTIVVAEEGAGKSAFLVAWSKRFSKKHSYDFMFKQYAGLNTESGAWAGIVRGILQGMKDKFNLRKEIPNEVEHLPGALSLWMGIMASLSARVIIMIDAVDRIHDIHVDPELEPPLDDDENDDDDHPLDRQPQVKPPHDLFWLPTIVPANIRIVVSVREGTPAHEQLLERKWGVFKLKPLDDESRQVLLKRFVKARGLDMPEGLQKKLLERGPTKKPLFLYTVMRSLQHPEDLKPTGALGTYLFARSVKELAQMVVDRLENTNGLQERCGLVEEVLSCVALSRRGLSESEIIAMMQVPRALFTKFYLQTRCMFQVFFGLMSFTCIEFYEEVRERYLVHDEIVVMIRNRIASFFTFRPLTTRTVEEVPWQYFQGRKWTELTLILTNPEVFMILTNTSTGMFDLTLYWDMLSKDSHDGGGGVNVVDKMEDCVRQSRDSQFPAHEQIALLISGGDLLQRLRLYDISMTYYRRACELEDREIGLAAISKIEYMLKETRIFLRKGDFQATRRMYDRTIKALTDLVDADGDGEITYEELKATDAGTLLLDTEEELMFLLYEGQYYSGLEEMCLHMLGRDEDRPTNELLLFDVLINTYMETGKLDSAHDFITRALAAIHNPECDEYVHVLARKLGLCLLRGNFLQAVETVEESGWVWEAIEGGDEENIDELIDILAFYCAALTQIGRAEDAVRILMVAVNKQYPSEDENNDDSSSSSSGSELSSVGDVNSDGKRDTRATRVNVVVPDVMLLDLVGMARREIYELDEAEAHHSKALSLKVLSSGPKDATNAYTLSELSAVYEQKRDMSTALKMRKAACAIIRETLGDRNSRYYMALQAQAATHWKFGDLETAYDLAKRVQGGIERLFGSRSEMLPSALLLLGLILTSLGELREAEQILNRSQSLSVTIWGEGCVAASNALFALAMVEERKGEYEQAELKLRQTVQDREDQLGPLHSYLQQDLAASSLLYFRVGAYQEVEDLLRTSLPAMQAVHGPNGLCVAGVLTLLALTHARAGTTRISDVEADLVAIALRAIRIRRNIFGQSAAVNQHAMLTALLFAHLGEHKRAEPLFRKAYMRATSSRKTPHHLRWLLYKHMERSGQVGFEASDRPQQPAWSDDYEDFAVVETPQLTIGAEPENASPVEPLRSPVTTRETIDMVDRVMDDIQEAVEDREREEETQASRHTSRQASAKSGRPDSFTRSRVSSRGSKAGESGAASEEGKEGEGGEGTEKEMYDQLVIGDDGGEEVHAAQSASGRSSARISQARGSEASSRASSSVGTEQAREELNMLGTTVVDMMDDIFDDVIGGFAGHNLELLPGRSESTGSDFAAHRALRPQSAPGVRRRPVRLEGLPQSERPQTAGWSRRGRLDNVTLDTQDDGLSDDNDRAVPRLSMTAVGRVRRRMDGMSARDEAGNTSLHAAVRERDADAVKSLLEAGANAGVANKAGESPLHLAAAAGDLRIVKLLAATTTASVNQHGPEGLTPLHLAVQAASLALVQTLCETYGADVSCQSNAGETPAQLASRVLGADASVSRYLESTMYSLPAV